jgi:transposase
MAKKESLQLALAALESGKGKLSIRAASKQFGVPYSTLQDHTSKRYTNIGSGHPTILTADEEKEIVYSCQVSLL